MNVSDDYVFASRVQRAIASVSAGVPRRPIRYPLTAHSRFRHISSLAPGWIDFVGTFKRIFR